VSEIACAPLDEDVAAAIVDGWIWLTTDGGRGWSRLALMPPSAEREDDPGESVDPMPEAGVIPNREEGDLFTGAGEPEDDWAAEEDDEGDADQGRGGPLLAVSDGGRWAIAADGALLWGGPGPGIDGSAPIGEARGLVFDARGRIWLAGEDALVTWAGAAVVGSLSVPGAGAPVGGSHRGQILVPETGGLRVIETAGALEQRVVRGAPVDAAAALPGGEGWLVATRGELERWGPGGREETLPGPGRRVRRVLADRAGGVRILAADGSWSTLSGGGFRAERISAAATDGAGRLWVGTATGPLSPEERIPTGPVEMDVRGMVDHLDLSREMLARFPGPPPCPPLPLNPVPAVRVLARFGRGDSEGFGDPLPARAGWARSWAFVGIRLSWDLDPLPAAACIDARGRWSEQANSAEERLAQLWIRWRKARARQRHGGDPVERFIAATEAERDAGLIEVLSGQRPLDQEEE